LEHHQQAIAAGPATTAAAATAPDRNDGENHDLNAGMPTTSAAAAATLRTIADPNRGERTKDTVAEKLRNKSGTAESGRKSRDSHAAASSIKSSSSNTNRNPNSSTTDKMVSRDGVNSLGSSCSTAVAAAAAVHSDNQVEKIILKLPKPASNPTHSNECHQQQQQAKLIDLDPTMSNSCSNNSTNSSIIAEPDTRKVEPLKINFHHGTIKPLIKKPETAEEPHEKSARKACGSSATSTASGDGAANTEPHIKPKLAIRADGGGTLTSVVTKLTIKFPDQQSAHNLHNILHSPVSTSRTETPQQPPLPKLTIKTTIDSTGGPSIMCSSISPALSSSNSSSSGASSPHNAASTTSNSSCSASSAIAATVPKHTVYHPALPKLTIKTLATGSCISTASIAGDPSVAADTEAHNASMATASPTKLSKLTIKTGQEYVVIITQHNSDQTIPKLPIKTKSLELDESLGSDVAEPPEKIPKFNQILTKLT